MTYLNTCWQRRSTGLILSALLCGQSSPGQSSVLTYHNDNGRTGQYLTETNLTPANVNTNSFGLLFSQPVDGQIYGQPLYVPGVAIPNKGMHNVVVVVTENDSVYAFDADNSTGSNAAALWQTNFLNPATGVTAVPNGDVNSGNIAPVIGITSTPVIDPTTQTIYVEAKTKEISVTATNYVHRLHALDLGSGAEKFGGPVVISPVINGTGDGNDAAGHVPFNGLRQLNRPGLLLVNGVIYIAYASHGDNGPYHGWLLGFNAQTLQPQGVYNATANAGLGGFWEGGDGPAADTNGALYAVTGNGGYDGAVNNDYGDSFIKLTPKGTNLALADSFTPFNQQSLANSDLDVGSGGELLLPDTVGNASTPHLLVGGGKQGTLYLINRDSFGGYNPVNNNQVVESVTNLAGSFATPAYYDGMLYYIGVNGALESFSCANGLLGMTPKAVGPETYGFPGATPSISAQGTNNGIVWAVQAAGTAVLRAYSATNVAVELYNSAQAGPRDALGTPVKFVAPTIAQGKVYVGTAAALAVFGNGLWSAAPVITPAGGAFTNSVSVTLSANPAGAQIYFTVNGTSPTTSSLPYTSPFVVTNTCAVAAIETLPNETGSSVSTAVFLLASTNTELAGFGGNWTLNGGAMLSSNVLMLTDGNGGESRSAFYNAPVFIGSFDAQFIYQSTGGADGTTFVMQNSASGAAALGGAGGALGYGGITPSAAVELNLYSGVGGTGTQFATNGNTGIYNSTLPLNLDGGDPIWVTLNYQGGTLSEQLLDLLSGASYETNYLANIPGTVGGTDAYVGFTGGTGGSVSVQTVTDFLFTEPKPPAPTPVIVPNGGFFTNSTLISLRAAVSPGQIFYTLDGSVPTTNAMLYRAPLVLTNTAAVKAIASAAGSSPSAAAFAFFGDETQGSGITGFGDTGKDWTLNGGATVTNNILTLTDGSLGEARSAFFNTSQFITNWAARFIYQSGGGADGTTFTMQNDVTGMASVGGGGGGLGFSGLTPSAAVELNLYSGQGGTGTRFATNGITTGYTSTLPLDLGSGDPIWVSLVYNGSTLTEDLVDQYNGNTFIATYLANLAAAVGGTNTAWTGFTGADGGVASVQTIGNFTFSPFFAPPILAASINAQQLLLTWTTNPLNYTVEYTTNLSSPAIWAPVTQGVFLSAGHATVTLSIGSTNTFYRLKAP